MTRAVGSPREGVSLWLRAVSRCCFLARDLAREDQSLTVAPPPTHLPQGHLELRDLFSPACQQAAGACEDGWIGLSRAVMSSLSRGVCQSRHPAGVLGRTENVPTGEGMHAEASQLPGEAGGEPPGPRSPRGPWEPTGSTGHPAQRGRSRRSWGACAGQPGTS